MKFARSTMAFATIAGLAASQPIDPTQRLLAINAEYAAIGPQLNELGLGALGSLGQASGINIDLSGLSKLSGNPVPYYSAIDLAALRANGYTNLADRLEKSANLGGDAAEAGLVALKSVIASDLTDVEKLTEANAAGLKASEAGLAALEAVPTPDSLAPGTIENLRALGLNRVADSLVNTKRGLEAADKAAKFLDALSELGVGPNAKGGALQVANAVNARTYSQDAGPAYRAPTYSGFYSLPQFGGYNTYTAGLSPYYG